jgi:K(+)-stimulated pyrophosphate-energized sodium pump
VSLDSIFPSAVATFSEGEKDAKNHRFKYYLCRVSSEKGGGVIVMLDKVVIGSTIIGILYTVFLSLKVLSKNPGNDKMQMVADRIHKGALTFLKKEYSILAVFTLVVTALLAYFINIGTAVSFVVGAVSSAAAGFVGMNIATKANVRTAQAAREGVNPALKVAFGAGQVLSLTCVSVGLLGVTILYLVYNNIQIIFGFGFGASSIALFARIGGGIYTKAADVGADLVGKVEQGLDEDDPRNPAVIADNVGDNVGDVAGMGADLFESYVGSILAAIAIGLITIGSKAVGFVLLLCAIGLIASIIGSFVIRVNSMTDIEEAFNKGIIFSSILIAAGGFFASLLMLHNINIFYCIVIGLITGILLGVNTERYTSGDQKYVNSIEESAKSGAATTILQGIVVGMRSTKNSMIVLALAIFFSFSFGGQFGIAIAAVAMLSTLGLVLAIDAYGPVVDNAGGIAEMAGMPKSVRKVTDHLDSVGNTAAAIGKGFATGSAALTALALFSSFIVAANVDSINVASPRIFLGVLIGGMIPFLLSSMTIKSVGNAALQMVNEVRRQFRTIKGLREGKAEADYQKCIEISTKAALYEMILPGVIAITTPLIIGFLFGAEAVGGLLVGSLISGIALALMFINSGGAWDNAKKAVEAMKHDKNWKDLHNATVIGDTVGDPFKDTAGPSLNILIKLMSIVSILCVALFSSPIF